MSKTTKLYFTLLLFSFLFILISRSSIEVVSDQNLNSIESEYVLRVDAYNNITTYYVESSDSVIDFKIQCLEWGSGYDQPYEGLVVELRFDSNESLLNSWLILRGDVNEHHFTSESPISGIIQIIFYSLNVIDIEFTMKISEDFSIWTYDTYLQNEERVFFGIERSVFDYESIDKIVLVLSKNPEESFNISVLIQDNYGIQIKNQTVPFFTSHLTSIDVEIEVDLSTDYWYSIRLVAQEMDNLTFLRVHYFYDHYYTPNIGRLFLSSQNRSLSGIPIDTIHRNSNYNWIVDEGELIIDPPPDMDWIIILLQAIVYTVYGGLYGTAVILVIKYLIKRRNRKRELEESKPSQKYLQMREHHATYAPEQIYGVNFVQKTTDYNLESDVAMNVMCSICLQKITNQSELIRCPSCDVAFHKNHLHQWIISNNNCPACRANLRITE